MRVHSNEVSAETKVKGGSDEPHIRAILLAFVLPRARLPNSRQHQALRRLIASRREKQWVNWCQKQAEDLTSSCTERKVRQRAKVLKKLGLNLAEASPCTFRHVNKDLVVFAHGDDFATLGALNQCRWLRTCLKKEWGLND